MMMKHVDVLNLFHEGWVVPLLNLISGQVAEVDNAVDCKSKDAGSIAKLEPRSWRKENR